MIQDHRRRPESGLRFWIGVTAEAVICLAVAVILILAASSVVPCTQAACGR